jgi:hypothetical protein
MISEPVECLIYGELCVQDPIEGMKHAVEHVDHHWPKVRDRFVGEQDSNQTAARIVREAAGE